MKKLNKLQINSEKIMKNEELLTLLGGCATCICNCSTFPEAWWGTYCSGEAMVLDIDAHCGSYSGGSCNCT